MIKTGFFSHLQPFNTLPAMRAGMPRIGTAPAQAQMRPGSPRFRQGVVAQQPPPPDCPTCPGAPAAAATAGFGYHFAAPMNTARARGHMHVSPYNEFRTGAWQGIRSSGRGMRNGVYGAGALIKRLMPGGFPNAGRQAGGYRPFPAAAPGAAAIAGLYY